MGAIPGGGSELPTMLSYSLEKNLSKNKDEFGHGAIEGVAGPEAANNAAAAGILVPLLTLGLPTSATAAILLVAFQNYGLQPGPFLFSSNPELVWGLIASLYVGNAMLLVLNLPLVGLWVRLLYIPKPQLYAGILVFAMIGIWGVSGSTFELAMMAGLGVVSYIMRVYGFPIAPLLIGLILVPLAENQLRTALAAGQVNFLVLLECPIAVGFYIAAILFLSVPYMLKRLQK
jgi:putative tricarboxylic transport membrane protein